MNMTFLTYIVAGIVSLLTLAVSWKALRECPGLDNPVIPFCVAGLCFLGLTTLNGQWITAILLPYAALGLAILLLLLFAAVARRIRDSKNRFNRELSRRRSDVRSRAKQALQNNKTEQDRSCRQ
jgi:hypothetical protein